MKVWAIEEERERGRYMLCQHSIVPNISTSSPESKRTMGTSHEQRVQFIDLLSSQNTVIFLRYCRWKDKWLGIYIPYAVGAVSSALMSQGGAFSQGATDECPIRGHYWTC